MSAVDTAILNANVITIDPQRPRAEALAIGQGRFVAVGTTAEVRGLIGPRTRVMDLRGKTVVPGFIDAHVHVLSSGVHHVMAVDCDLRSIGAVQAALRGRAGGTDYVPGPYQPLMGIQSCVTRTDSSGKVWGPNQRVTPEEALRIYTLHGAYAGFEEKIKGSIEAGKLADLVALGADPTAVDPHAIKDIPIEKTPVGGEVVYEAR